MDWFERLTGFRESGIDAVQRHLRVDGDRLESLANGASYCIGRLELASLADMRHRVTLQDQQLPGPLRVSVVPGDARKMHRDPEYRDALFQVASQFNLLEMTSPAVSPEDGVTRYAHDPTQGPACAIAAGAATIFRNYFASLPIELLRQVLAFYLSPTLPFLSSFSSSLLATFRRSSQLWSQTTIGQAM